MKTILRYFRDPMKNRELRSSISSWLYGLNAYDPSRGNGIGGQGMKRPQKSKSTRSFGNDIRH
ncbi:MAG: hypothetical protein ACTJLL_02545 [Anaplasma sp.]